MRVAEHRGRAREGAQPTSAMMAFHTAAQMDAAMEAAEHGHAVGRAYSGASRPEGGFRLAQGPLDKALGRFEAGTGPLLGQVVDANGVPRGNLHVVEYEKTPGGARLVLRYDNINTGAEDLNWLQTVDTTIPRPAAGNPSLDNQYWRNGTAFYYSDAEVAEFTVGDSLYFSDQPFRSQPANWGAELSLVGQFQGSPYYSPLITVSWGFTTGGTLLPVQLVGSPTSFHLGQVP